MKICFKCQKEQSLDEFYIHPQMFDGHLNKCKTCTKIDSEARRRRLEKEPEWALKERERQRVKQRNAARNRKVTIPTQANRTESIRTYRKKNPEKYAAHSAVNNALRDGRLHRHPCCICGNKAQAHHEDYSKPLEVIWFCPKHHGEHHYKKRDQEIMKKLTK